MLNNAVTSYIETLRSAENRERVIVHQLDGTWQTESKFPAIEYSKFKYGSGEVAQRFGEEMADAFMNSGLLDLRYVNGSDIVITASPYKYVQPAAASIKRYFTNRLNAYLDAADKDSANMVKMTRSVMFEGDYGKLTEEGRTSLLKQDKLTIDRDFIKGKTLLVLDDIKITGAHEEKIVNMLLGEEIETTRVIFLYYGELLNPTEVGADYENYLNHFYVKSTAEIIEIMKEPNFIINARICKFLLSTDEHFGPIFHQGGREFLYNLLAAIIGDGYHRMPTYEHNYSRLLQYWDTHYRGDKLNRLLAF